MIARSRSVHRGLRMTVAADAGVLCFIPLPADILPENILPADILQAETIC